MKRAGILNRHLSGALAELAPEGVTVVSKARTITVTGPRGTLTKKVGHIQMDIQVVSRLRPDRAEAAEWSQDAGRESRAGNKPA